MHSKLSVEIKNVRSELKVEIEKINTHVEKTKSEIIKWMFIFWTGTVIIVLGGLLVFLSLLLGK